MKKIFIILFLQITFFTTVNAQCKKFTEENVFPLLESYVISGRYNSLKLYEGDEILIFKTVSKGLKYRFIVKGSDNLPNIRFVVKDWEDNLLFDNKNENFTNIWDFSNKKTQRLKVFIMVPGDQDKENPERGCVTFLSGIKIDGDK